MSGSSRSGRVFDKAGPAARRLARRAGAKAVAARERDEDAVKPHRGDKRAGLMARIIGEHRQVVLQVVADARKRRLHGDAVLRQPVRIADAGQHQQLRRVDDAARKDDLARSASRHLLAAAVIFDADGAAPVEHDACASAPVSTLRLERVSAGAGKPRRHCSAGRGGSSAAYAQALPAGRRCNRWCAAIAKRRRRQGRRR